MYFLVHFLYYFKSAGTRGGDGRGLFCVMAAWGGRAESDGVTATWGKAEAYRWFVCPVPISSDFIKKIFALKQRLFYNEGSTKK